MEIEKITKRLAAIEVIKNTIHVKFISIFSITAYFLILLTFTFSKAVGYLCLMFSVAVSSYFLYLSQKNLVYLKNKYNL